MGVGNGEMLEICKFVWSNDICFSCVIRSSLSIRVVKSKNEFAAAEILRNTGVGHVTKNFGKIDLGGLQKTENVCSVSSLPSTSVYFSGLAGGRSLRACVPLWKGHDL